MPISSAVAALIITSVLSGCAGTGVEPVAGPTTTSGAAATAAGAGKAAEAAAVAEAAKTTEAAAVAGAKIAADAKAATAAMASTAATAAAAAKAGTVTAAKAKPVAVHASATLRETCPKVERAVNGLTGKTSPPTAPKLAAALAQLKLLSGAGDAETKRALSALIAALPGYRDEDPTGVANDGRRAALDSMTDLADRCAAAGSTALRWVG